MTNNPWTDPDPQPGDVDAELALLDESAFEFHDGVPSAMLRIVVSIEGADASRLARIAETRGEKPSDVVADCYATPIVRPPSAGAQAASSSDLLAVGYGMAFGHQCPNRRRIAANCRRCASPR